MEETWGSKLCLRPGLRSMQKGRAQGSGPSTVSCVGQMQSYPQPPVSFTSVQVLYLAMKSPAQLHSTRGGEMVGIHEQ